MGVLNECPFSFFMADSNFHILVDRLVSIRLSVGMTQYALAKVLDVSASHLDRLEKKAVRSTNLLVDYIFFLREMGVPSDYLLGGEGECDFELVSANIKRLLEERKRTRRVVGNVDEDFII